MAAGAREFGLDTRLVRGPELQSVVPGLAGDWVGGMYTPGDGHADPVKATDALVRGAAAHGVVIHLGCTVQAVTTRDGTGRFVTELIVDGKTSLDIGGFRVSRFAEGAIGKPRNVL